MNLPVSHWGTINPYFPAGLTALRETESGRERVREEDMKENKTHITAYGSALLRVLLSAVSAVSLAACTGMEQNGSDEEIACGDIPVSFEACGRPDEAPDTRTATSGSSEAFAEGDAMGVTAYWIKDGGDISVTVPNFMYNQKVTYSEGTSGDGSWSYAPVKYWPLSGKVNFYAWFPYAVHGRAGIDLTPNIAKGKPALTYRNPDADIDLMAGSAEGLFSTGSDSPSPVSLTLRHLLARVRFKFTYEENSAYEPVIHLVRFDAPVCGVYDYAASLITASDSYETISKFTKTADGVVINNHDGQIVEDFTCYMLPCSFPAGQENVGKFQFLLNNVIHEYTPAEAITVESGKNYVLNFKVNYSAAEKGFFIASYSLWDDGGTIDGKLQ